MHFMYMSWYAPKGKGSAFYMGREQSRGVVGVRELS